MSSPNQDPEAEPLSPPRFFIEYLVTPTLALVTTVGEAALAAMGMDLLLKHSKLSFKVAYDVGAALCSAVIEGEIYLQNIRGAVNYLFLNIDLKHKIASDLIIARHNAKAHENPPAGAKAEDFADLYISLYQEKNPDQKEDLYYLEELAIDYLENSLNNEEQKQALDDFFDPSDKETFQTHWQTKNVCLYISYVVTALAATGAFFTATCAIATMLTFIGLAVVANPGFIVTIATIFAIAGALTLYRTFKRIIYDDLFKNFWSEMQQTFNTGSTGQKIVMIITGIIMLALIVCLTFSIAGTFWYTSVDGQIRLFQCTHWAMLAGIGIFSGFHSLGDLTFNIKNIVESFNDAGISFQLPAYERVKKYFSDEININFKKPIKDLFFSDTCVLKQCSDYAWPFIFTLALITCILQIFINILFMILKPVALLLHAFCQGLTTDAAFFIPIPLAATVNAIMELLNDVTYITSERTQHRPTSDTDEHLHSNLPQKALAAALTLTMILPLTVVLYTCLSNESRKKIKKYTYKRHTQEGHDHHSHHGHNQKNTAHHTEIPSLWKKPASIEDSPPTNEKNSSMAAKLLE